MIDRSEILASATDLGLSPDIVEKDYVLGWLLAGINNDERLRNGWVFKGGTCLKKCYFETYRFSEDLDFTVTDSALLEPVPLRELLTKVVAWIYEQTGIVIPADQMRFDPYDNQRGGHCCEGRIYYNGPLQRARNLPRIKLDLTSDEILVLPPELRPIGHIYTDRPENGFEARCYTLNEVFAEKVRALGERTRPRDLYDVINLFRNSEHPADAASVSDVLQRKCAYKGILVTSLASLSPALEELTADWNAMLSHQLPALPPVQSFLSALPGLFAWLAQDGTAPPLPGSAPMALDEEAFRPPVGLLRMASVGSSRHLEVIRFAAANRLCVDLQYQGSTRRIEPYSLRRTTVGDILLFAVRSVDGESRSYRLDRVQSASVTDQSFTPRYAVELSPSEYGAIPPTTRSQEGSYSTRARSRHRHSGPTYIYQCSYCQKKFRRSRLSSRLNPHKNTYGYPCPGKTGYLLETRY